MLSVGADKPLLLAGKPLSLPMEPLSVIVMAGMVVVFDFDRTIIDGDSDNCVVTAMGMTHLFNQLLRTMPWNSLMNRMMEEIHSQGKTTNEIAECLKRTPLHPRIIAAVKSAHAFGCDLRIVSDSNQFFIETILKHHGILDCFSEIVTNPSFVDKEGRLRISPFQDFMSSPQICKLCPSNMCKGSVIKRIQDSAVGKSKRFIYLGDGKNDFCPTIKLGEGDYVMPRKNFPLSKRIHSNPELVKAEVHEWSDGKELEKILLRLIDTICIEENISCNSNHRKFLTVPASTHEALHQTLPVPQ